MGDAAEIQHPDPGYTYSFRYKGASVVGETMDADGVVLPNIKESVDAFGFTFHKRKFTEVPLEAVAYRGRTLDREAGKLVPCAPTVVEKLLGNREFEMKCEPIAKS